MYIYGLQAFQDGEVLEGENAYRCPSCKKAVEASRRLQLYTMPEVFVVHLKRFKTTFLYSEQLGKKVAHAEKIETMVGPLWLCPAAPGAPHHPFPNHCIDV